MAEINDLADDVGRYARSIGSVGGSPTRQSALARVHDALALGASAAELLGATARAARAAGCTWQEIGDAAGVTRQAAFQRFGRPIDPRTGEPMNRSMIAHVDVMATDVLDKIRAGDWAAVVDRFTETMAAGLDVDQLATAWASVIALGGEVEGLDTPFARMHGLYSVVDIGLRQEAGEYVFRVSFDEAGKIAGLFFLEPDAAATGR